MRRTYELTSGDTLSYRGLLQCYRHAMGMGRALFIPIPMGIMRITARLAEALPQRVLSRDTLSMLAGGNTSTGDDAARLLKRAPIKAEQFIPAAQQAILRQEAVNGWALPVLHASLALMWIATAYFSLTQQDVSLDLLGRCGIHGTAATIALYAAVTLDLLLGLLTLWRPTRTLWLAQIILVTVYTVIITLRLPEFWVHPFGPLLKNLPIVAMLLYLYALTPVNRK